MSSFKELELDVIRWAEARKIIPNSTPIAQVRKTLEEVGELLEAAAGLRTISRILINDPDIEFISSIGFVQAELRAEFKDGVGDVLVTLINACALADVDLTECLAEAYDEIKDRRGTLLPSGIFQKDEN